MPVPARYHALRDRVVAAVDWRFAEPVQILFMKAGKADPDRPKQDPIDAVVRTSPSAARQPGDGNGRDWLSRTAAQPARCVINRTTYDGPPIRTGDRIIAISRAGEPWFEVAQVDDRNHARIVLYLSES